MFSGAALPRRLPGTLAGTTRSLCTALTLFDTHKLVSRLRRGGLTHEQAESVLEAFSDAMQETCRVHGTRFSTKDETLQVRGEMKEKVFNANLKADIHHRHQRQIVERDFAALRADIMAAEQADMARLEKALAALDKAIVQQKGRYDEDLANIRAQIQMVEASNVKFSVGLIGSVAALFIALVRLMM